MASSKHSKLASVLIGRGKVFKIETRRELWRHISDYIKQYRKYDSWTLRDIDIVTKIVIERKKDV